MNEFGPSGFFADILGQSPPEQALRQVGELCGQAAEREPTYTPDRRAFQIEAGDPPARRGVLTCHGEIEADKTVAVRCEIARVPPAGARIGAQALFNELAALSDKCRLIKTEDGPQAGPSSIWLELRVQATPLSLARSTALLGEIKKIDALARVVQEDLPLDADQADLDQTYKSIAEYVAPVHPLADDLAAAAGPRVTDWAAETCDLLRGAVCVAVASEFSVSVEFALAALARAGRGMKHTFGRVIIPAINAKALIELARKAPGVLAVPATQVSLGVSPYELHSEMQTILEALSAANQPVLFHGRYAQLQAVFHGGQGGENDPLRPAVRRAPEAPFEVLADFTIRAAGRLAGGLPSRAIQELTQEVIAGLQAHSSAERLRLLPAVARRAVRLWADGRRTGPTTDVFARSLGELGETLAGLSIHPRVHRSPTVQERFTRVIASARLLDFLREHLIAQDDALQKLADRLRAECLTRPPHQPIRYCAQGAPGTGKSESAVLLARLLNIPYVNIDAASMPDYHTAAAQLLGSGRGIVGSHQAGRLEQAAKHHEGVVVEISDLDHAPPQVRAPLADLFLQVLETGEAQSATGAMFSCANMIFAFTMNLPGGMDEGVYKSIGFANAPSGGELTARVAAQIREVLSGAFLSRVGTPILFAPLAGDALAVIVERAVRAALLAAAERLGAAVVEVRLDPGVGRALLDAMGRQAASFGARGLLEYGRNAAADAMVRFLASPRELAGETPWVSAEADGALHIRLHEERT